LDNQDSCYLVVLISVFPLCFALSTANHILYMIKSYQWGILKLKESQLFISYGIIILIWYNCEHNYTCTYHETTHDQRKISWYICHKPWLTMVHSDKPWPMICDVVILICLCRTTGSLWLWEFIIALFSILQHSSNTLAIIWVEKRKK